MTAPIASVIIPTYNRKDSLLRTLDSLDKQTYPTNRFEVIVVDDGGSDGTEAVTRQAFSFPLRYHHQSNQGDAIARNAGAQQSTAGILIFIDDDIITEPDCIAGFVDDLGNGGKRIVIGLLRPWSAKAATPFELVSTRTWEERSAMVGEVHFSECLSGFLAIRRQHFLDLGMMQPVTQTGSSVWCDVEFAYRAYQNGFVFHRSAAAVGHHDDCALRDLATSCRRAERAARTAVPLFVKYPELFSHIPAFHDKAPIAWQQDPSALIFRKIARQIASSVPAMRLMEAIVPLIERHVPTSKLLALLYRWSISGYIYRGYRDGLQKAQEQGPV